MALNRFLPYVRVMGPGDWMPFVIVAIAAFLAIPFPGMMIAVAFAWWLFATVGLTLNAKPSMTRQECWTLWFVFSVPAVFVIGTATFSMYL